MSGNWQPQVPAEEINGGPIEGGPDGVNGSKYASNEGVRKKVVVVGLGMVGISFMCVFPICQLAWILRDLLTNTQRKIDETRREETRI